MDRIAFIIGNTPVYWNSVILALGAAAAVCFFLEDWLREKDRSDSAALVVPMALLLSLLLSRALHWYFRADSYSSAAEAMLDLTHGGFALTGVFLGSAAAAVILRAAGYYKNLPAMLDSMAMGAAPGIALGRLACFFSPSDRGVVLKNIHFLPFAWPVTNNVTGQPEYRSAVFLFQAASCAVIFVILRFFRRKKQPAGDTAILFMLLYGLSQTILDSMRYDSLFFRSNGFIGVSQLLGALTLCGVCILVSVRLCLRHGFRRSYLAVWLGMAAAIGLAGYMEYYVQRHGNLAVFSYSVMTVSLFTMTGLALNLFFCEKKLTAAGKHRHKRS